MKKKTALRPPVVTLMGHVDHGKTSLLDAIRKSRVASGEFGQITQHIGAYTVDVGGRKITFLDTPGHEAFTAMRARGAQVTDIVILVVSLEDGLMPQTVEAINHCHDAGVPIIAALNKVDRGRANIPRVKAQLSEHNVIDESLGGQTLFVETAATKGTGVDQLLEAILLQSEIMELKADYSCSAEGVVIESSLERGTGPNVTVVVRNGVLKKREALVAGETSGKVRLLLDDGGKQVSELSPGLAGRVVGLDGVPAPGVAFRAVATEKEARSIASGRAAPANDRQPKAAITLEEFYQQLKSEEAENLNIVLRADVPGSLEAIMESLGKISSDEVRLKFIHTGIGNINESDILLARASDSIVVGFNVSQDAQAKAAAAREKVQVRIYRVIYELLDDVAKALSGLLAPELKEVVTGQATVKEVFVLSNGQVILGSQVGEGRITRGTRARLVRDGKTVAESVVFSLRRFKENVREVAAGYECGIGFQKVEGARSGDTIVAYTVEEVSRSV